jgi:uncharacterized OB-fold protein
MSYLAAGLPAPVPARDGLDAPFWDGLADEKLLLQRCQSCDLTFEETEATGIVYSHQRVWHPVHPALAEQGAFVVVLIELPHADNVRMVGNLLGDPMQELEIGAAVTGVYEHHTDNDPNFTLLQWQTDS